MTSITLNVTGAKVQAAVNGPLTSGMVGIPVTIRYDDAWNGLTKNLVCRCGQWGPEKGETRTVLNIGEAATVAHEVMQANMHLYLGLAGYSADGKLVIPTTWADCGWIQHGANAGADLSADPKLSVWAQLQAQIEQIRQESITEGELAAAVGAYLEENPIHGSDSSQNVDLTGYATEQYVQEYAQPKGDYLANTELTEAINTALAQAKASGEFDGADGQDGAPGADGADARIISQAEPPEDTSVLWVDTSDESTEEAAFANPLYGKSISFNGDSITAASSNYGKIISDRNAMTYQNIAVSGATIAYYTSSTTGATYHCISRTVEDMDETADYAIVQGGINDSVKPVTMGSITDGFDAELDDTTFYGAFEYMCKRLILRFPGKKIGYIAMHKCQHGDFDSRNTDGYYQAAKKCCEKWGVPFCDLNTTVPPLGLIEELKTAYTSNGDGVHPTAEGYRKFYCDKIEAWLKAL